MSPMRIAVFHNLGSGGAKRHVYEQVRELARRGHRLVEYRPSTADADFCPLAAHVAGERVFAAPPLVPLARRVPFLTPYLHAAQTLAALRRADRVQRRIAAAIDADHHDLALVNDCRLTLTPPVLRHLRTRSVFFCHHSFAPLPEPPLRARGVRELAKGLYYAPVRGLLARRLRRFEQRNARAAGAVLTASRFARAQVAAHYAIDAEVVGAGVDVERFRPRGVEPGDYLLSVGELSAQKDPTFLVIALARLPAPRRPPLVVAANAEEAGEVARLERHAAELGVTVRRVRVMDDRELAALYAAARAFLYAPHGEMLGLACLEAMSCGVPVVAVREGGVAETVVDGITGWLSERDPDAFAARVASLLDDPALRRRMGAAAAEHVRNEWTWVRAMDRIEAVLRRVARA